MRSFTPGPWELESRGWDGQFIYGQDERAHGRRFIADVSLDYDGAEANARLIAAAPELLEQLTRLFGMCVRQLDFNDDGDGLTFERVRAVIAKATGGAA